MRRFLIISFLLLLNVLHPSAVLFFDIGGSALGKETPDSSEEADEALDPKNVLAREYKQATSFFTTLKSDKERCRDKANWETAVANFQRIHDRQPLSLYAGASLFMMGRITYSRFRQFNDSAELDKAMTYYQQVVTLFPWHELADDALLTLGRIQLEDKKDPQEAARLYTRITTEYYSGEMAGKAMERLQALAKEYNTPVPAPPTAPVADSAPPSSDTGHPENTTPLPNVKNRSYVLPVEYWSSNNYTRIVINASRPVTFKEELLEKVGDQPRRLFIDFDKSYIEPKYRAPIPIKDGLLQQVRTAQFSPDTVRVVLDIESIESYKIYSLPDPFRVIVDVHGQSTTPTVAADVKKITAPELETAKAAPPAPDSPVQILQDSKKIKRSAMAQKTAPERGAPLKASALSLAQQLNLGVRRIVIDPGHGGKDPGASAFGLKEKDIVLQVAKRLAAALKQELGCEVILTRDKDVFLSLEERTAIANTNGADLFISLHLNAHSSPQIFGFETYYLNLSTDPEAIRVAALENATSTHQLSDLQGILSDIMKNSKIDESSRLAKQVQDALTSGLTDRKYPQVKSLGVKQAPFYVLIGAEMPAVLVEMAFISNKTDANHVKKETYQDALAAEITHGLKKYIRTTTAGL